MDGGIDPFSSPLRPNSRVNSPNRLHSRGDVEAFAFLNKPAVITKSSDELVPLKPLLRTPRLKKRVRQLTNARLFGKPVARTDRGMLQPPECLRGVLEKIGNTQQSAATVATNRTVNARLMTSLFLRNFDTDELSAVVHSTENMHSSTGAVFEEGSSVTFDEFGGQTTVTKNEDSIRIQYHNEHVNTDRYMLKNSHSSDKSLQPRDSHSIHSELRSMYDQYLTKAEAVNHHEGIKRARDRKLGLVISDNAQKAVGGLQDLSANDSAKYFGIDARTNFFEHYKRMDNLKNAISTQQTVSEKQQHDHAADVQSTAGVSALTWANDSHKTLQRQQEPKSSNPNLNQSLSQSQSQSQSHSRYSELFNAHSISSIANSQLSRLEENVSVYAKRSMDASAIPNSHFFQDLQAYAGSSKLSKKLDQEILLYDKTTQQSTTRSKKGSKTSSRYEKRNLKHVRQLEPLNMEGLSIAPSAELYSPRTIYIAGCIREGVCPLPNLILRKNFTSKISLAHYGIGDKMGKILAECLQYLPQVQQINLKDNNLTDHSLQYLLGSIVHIKTLTDLDLSRNKIDGASSEALAEYVSREDCPLIRLTLQSADIDDGECDSFVKCLISNRQLLELDMSSNLLGSAESLAAGNPNIITGGESIANFIKSELCRLEVLKLSWNAIRLQSAIKLCSALTFNHTITELDLSSNGLGYAAGEVLGDSIMENRTLRQLNVANNSFSSTSCISICVGIAENLAMKTLNMNENPIGDYGAKAIMQISIDVGSRVQISAANCNTIASDSRCWYDPSQPCRDYYLCLDQPFDRAVAFHLLRVVAYHSTFIFGKVSFVNSSIATLGRSTGYRPSPEECKKLYGPSASANPWNVFGTKEEIFLDLEQNVQCDREHYLDAEQQDILKGLRLLESAASNEELATKLFYEADADNSGRLDEQELQEVLQMIGLKMDIERLQDMLSTFDVDGAGTIDLSEFQSLLRSQFREAQARIKDLTEYPIMCLASDIHKKYIPPRNGILYMKVLDGFVRKKTYRTVSTIDQKYAYQMAKGIGDLAIMSEAFKNSKLRFEEALAMYKSMFKESGDKIAVLKKVLPQMLLPSEARQLASKVTNDDRVELGRLKQAFGVAMKPIFGLFNGYFMLDLSNELHRICLVRLIEQSETTNSMRARNSTGHYGMMGDTSQHGNWSSFRNELFNGSPIVLTSNMFNPMPKTGSLEFDFASVSRPLGGELRLTDKRLCKVMRNICLLPADYESDAMSVLSEWKKETKAMNIHRTMYMPTSQFDVKKAKEVGLMGDKFYQNLADRKRLNLKGMKKEEIKVNFMRHANRELEAKKKALMEEKENAAKEESSVILEQSELGAEASILEEQENEQDEDLIAVLEDGGGGDAGNGVEQILNGEDLSVQSASYDSTDGMNNSYDENAALSRDVDGPIAQLAADYDSDDSHADVISAEAKHKKRVIRELRIRLTAMLNSKHGVSQRAKAVRMVEVMEETFGQVWILTRHLMLIVQLFKNHFDSVARTEFFGSYCVEVVISLLPRVIDIHNIEFLFELLDAQESACVFARIGLLNLFNPMKPEVTIELNLSHREDRLIAKMICYLAVVEPGENLLYKSFQWKREWDPMPGFEVTESWMTHDGLPDHGYFIFTYYSGEGKGKLGCNPNLNARKALMHLTLVDENELIDEDAMMVSELVNSSVAHYVANQTVWDEYLLNNNPVSK